jgi:hypothetical protein
MSAPELCTKCGYGIPADAATCPGCGRRHRAAQLDAPAHIPSLAQRLGLLAPARRTRRLIVVAGWLSAAFGLAALARFTVGLDAVNSDVPDALPGHIVDAAVGLAWATVTVLVAATVSALDWMRRTYANLPALHLERTWTTPWSLIGWAVPGSSAREGRRLVDAQWRDTSVAVAQLPKGGRGWRRPVSRVVLRWWGVWSSVPATVIVIVGLSDSGLDRASAGELQLACVAAAALFVVALRSAYDIIGIVTVAQAHRGQALLVAETASARIPPARHRTYAFTEDQIVFPDPSELDDLDDDDTFVDEFRDDLEDDDEQDDGDRDDGEQDDERGDEDINDLTPYFAFRV